MKKLLSFLFIGIILFSGCGKDDESPQVLSKDEAKKALETLQSDLVGDIVTLSNSEGIRTIEEIMIAMDMSSPDFMGSARVLTNGKKNGQQIRKAASDLRKFALLAQQKENGEGLFDFNEHKGIYDIVDGELVKTGESNKIIINVPATNAVATLHSYTEIAYSDPYNTDLEYLPTYFKADIFVEGKKEVEVEYTGSFVEGNESVSLNIFLNPFTFKFSVKNNNHKSIGFALNIEKDVTIVDIDINVNFVKDITDGEISTITGHVAYRTTKLQGKVDVQKLNNAQVITDEVELQLYSHNKKLGDVVFISNEPYLKYSDGSTEPLESIFAGMF